MRCKLKKEDRSLFKMFPSLKLEWDFQSNTVDPEGLSYGSGLKVYWICSSCGMRYQCTINNRTKGRGCSYCAHKRVREGESLKDKYKELCEEWHKSNSISPSEVSSKSSIMVNWECKNCKHVWVTRIYNRTMRKSGCPQCARKK